MSSSFAYITMKHVRLTVDPVPVPPTPVTPGAVRVFNPYVVRLPIRQAQITVPPPDHAIVRQKHQRVALDAGAGRSIIFTLQVPIGPTTVATGRRNAAVVAPRPDPTVVVTRRSLS